MTVASPNLTQELQSLVDSVNDIRQRVEKVTANVSEEALLWTPSPKVWSMAQILEHLNRAGYGIVPGMEQAVETLNAENKRNSGPFKYSLMERMFIRMVSPNPPFKSPVPPAFEPSVSQVDLKEALPKFLALQDKLIESMTSASGLDLKAATIPSVVNARMKFCLGAWYHATVAHEQYHLLQLEALKANPAFDK
jgi:hypothetical protein